MNDLKDDHFSVTHALEIQRALKSLLADRVLVRLDVPGKNTSIISTILELDTRKKLVLLDNSSEDDINTRLLRADSVDLQGMLNGVMIQFSGRLVPALHDERPALAMAWPQAIRRIQRREFFRVNVPYSNPATCLLHHESFDDETAVFVLSDISAGGLQLMDRKHLLKSIPAGTIFSNCTLEMPDVAQLEIGLRLVRTQIFSQDNGKPLDLVGFSFYRLPGNYQITIQNYIGSLERAILARRWGID